MIDLGKLSLAGKKFETLEKRHDFFTLATNLLEKGFEIEADIIILATWNFASFRYAAKKFNLECFRRKIEGLKPLYNKIECEDLKTINFDIFKGQITKIYDTLSSIKGVEYTGAPKLMHLKNPRVFIMWDGYIRGEKSKKDYRKLPLYRSGQAQFKKYGIKAKDYIQFLKDMQAIFKDVNIVIPGKTLAKAIDEYNYVNITLPLQKMAGKRKSFAVRSQAT